MFQICVSSEWKYAGQCSFLDASFQCPGYWPILRVGWALGVSKQAKRWNKKKTHWLTAWLHGCMWIWDTETMELAVYKSIFCNEPMDGCSKTTLKCYGLFDINMPVRPCCMYLAVPRFWDTKKDVPTGKATSTHRHMESALWWYSSLTVLKASSLFTNLFWVWKVGWIEHISIPCHLFSTNREICCKIFDVL